MSLPRCVRSSSVTLRPPPTPRVDSDADSLAAFVPRPLCLSVKVPRLSFYPHTLVWRFHTLCARAASSCQHSDYMALLYRVSQRLSTMNRQVECNPTLEGSHMAFKLNWCHHERHPSLRAPAPSQLLETCHPCDAREDQAKDSPTKKQAMSPGPHRELLPAKHQATQAPQPAEEPLDRHHLSFIRHKHPQTGDPPKKRSVGLPL